MNGERSIFAHSLRAGFTLVELMLVILIMGIVSVSVIPAMSNIESLREGAARDDIVRMLEVAKGRAVASGVPHGLGIDLSTSTLTVYRIHDDGSVKVEIDPLTNNERAIMISSLYSGVSIDSFVNGNGSGGSGTVWFDYEASPHMRAGGGGFSGLNSSQAMITISSGEVIIVHPYSGVVEVQ